MPYFARQVNPEYQESPLMCEEITSYYNVCIYGNKGFNGCSTETHDRVKNCMSELVDVMDDFNNRRHMFWYKTITQACNGIFPRLDGKGYTTQQVAEWKRIAQSWLDNGETWDNNVGDFCAAMGLIDGVQYDYSTICGCSQSDWQNIIYPANWTREDLHRFGAEYWNMGTEWIIGESEDGEEIYDPVSYYTVEWDENAIKEDIAKELGIEPEELTLLVWDGQTQTNKYRKA